MKKLIPLAVALLLLSACGLKKDFWVTAPFPGDGSNLIGSQWRGFSSI
jgi:hypothetical protein